MNWKKHTALRVLIFICLILTSRLLVADWGTVQDIQMAGDNNFPVVAMNGSKHAIAAWTQIDGGDTIVQASYFNGDSWAIPVSLTSAGTASNLQVVFNNQGIGFAIWQLISGVVQGAYFNAASWGPLITFANNNASGPAIVLNDAGVAFAAWTFLNGTNNEIHVSQYDGNTWSSSQSLTSTSLIISPSLAINASSHALLATVSPQQIPMKVFYFDGSSWSESPVPTVLQAWPVIPLLNDNGNRAIVWDQNVNSVFTVFAMRYDGANWGSPIQLSSSDLNCDSPDADMNNSGLIVVVWRAYESATQPHFPQSVYYNGSEWSSPIVLSTMESGYSPKVKIANSGNAIAIWRGHDNRDGSSWYTQAAMFSHGLWGAPINVSYSDEASVNAALTMNENGQAIAIWQDVAILNNNHIEARLFEFVPFGAVYMYGSIKENRFATQIDRIKILKWDPITYTTILSYQIFRNGTLIATLSPNGPFKYEDHNRKKRKKDTYTIVAVTSLGSNISASIAL